MRRVRQTDLEAARLAVSNPTRRGFCVVWGSEVQRFQRAQRRAAGRRRRIRATRVERYRMDPCMKGLRS